MKRIFVVLALALIAPHALADTGFAMGCEDADAATKGTARALPQCVTRSWSYPRPDSFVLSCLAATGCRWGAEDARYRSFETLPDDAVVNVCTYDIAAGTFTTTDPCSPSEAGKAWIPKSQVRPADPPTFNITARWSATTHFTNGTLISTPVSYVVTWYTTDPAGVAIDAADVEVSGTSVQITAPLMQTCVQVRARTQELLSESSGPVCVSPRPRTPRAPADVVVELGSP